MMLNIATNAPEMTSESKLNVRAEILETIIALICFDFALLKNTYFLRKASESKLTFKIENYTQGT